VIEVNSWQSGKIYVGRDPNIYLTDLQKMTGIFSIRKLNNCVICFETSYGIALCYKCCRISYRIDEPRDDCSNEDDEQMRMRSTACPQKICPAGNMRHADANEIMRLEPERIYACIWSRRSPGNKRRARCCPENLRVCTKEHCGVFHGANGL
jgi:hypothetical protein